MNHEELLQKFGESVERLDRAGGEMEEAKSALGRAGVDLRSATHELRRHVPTVEEHDKKLEAFDERISTLETERAAGVGAHYPSGSEPVERLDMPTPPPPPAPPLGPHRARALSVNSEVKESMRVQAMRTERLEKETAKQTPMIETLVTSATRTPMWTALASGGGIFLAYFLATLLQTCRPGMVPNQPQRPTYTAPALAPTAAPAVPAPRD